VSQAFAPDVAVAFAAHFGLPLVFRFFGSAMGMQFDPFATYKRKNSKGVKN
jgi:hypothetical protein